MTEKETWWLIDSGPGIVCKLCFARFPGRVRRIEAAGCPDCGGDEVRARDLIAAAKRAPLRARPEIEIDFDQRRQWAAWLDANGHDLAPITGTDRRALEAIDACWDLYAISGDPCRRNVIAAVVALLGAMQEKCWPLAKALIPRAMDWSDEEPVWKRVTDALPALDQLRGPRPPAFQATIEKLDGQIEKMADRLNPTERAILGRRLGFIK